MPVVTCRFAGCSVWLPLLPHRCKGGVCFLYKYHGSWGRLRYSNQATGGGAEMSILLLTFPGAPRETSVSNFRMESIKEENSSLGGMVRIKGWRSAQLTRGYSLNLASSGKVSWVFPPPRLSALISRWCKIRLWHCLS